jgi:hypothetical protein
LALCGSGGGRCEVTSAFPGGGARRPGPERQLGVLRPPAFGLWPEARPRVFPGWQTAPGGREVAVWPCAAAAEAGGPSLRLFPVEAPGARAQRGSWASCAPQPLASGPKHVQGYLPQWCMSSGEVGVRSSACGSRLVGAMGHEPSETKRAGHLCDLPSLGGPGQGQGYAGARVRVTFRWIGTAARSLDPILLHPGKSWILTSRE